MTVGQGLRRDIRRESGFTLVETMVVLAIVAIVAAAGTALLRPRSGGLEVGAAARDVASSLRASRAKAIWRNVETTVTIDVDDRQFWTHNKSAPRTLPKTVSIEAVLARSERISESASRIRFFPNGGSTGGEIHIRRGAEGHTVRVDWLTGAVKIEAIRDER